ncbi:MAG: (2Fe-2S) ferredoxin domain-containing protein [Candidatus Omnitrophica bacterium]|nr:(2Fe-2S) ferredoxin domain-containing protein [Candidatus Omnitrophota bacterium]
MGMTKDQLLAIKDETLKKQPASWIRVGYSTCGVAAGAKEVYEVLCEEIKARNLTLEIKKCGCVGLCSAEPLVEVNVEGAPRVFYGKVNKEIAHKIMDEHVSQKKLVDGHIYDI